MLVRVDFGGVIADGRVTFGNQTLSPSAAALKAVRQLGYLWAAVELVLALET
jgi:hypothetical protein